MSFLSKLAKAFTGSPGKGKTGSKSASHPEKRTFVPYPKQKDPNSKRSQRFGPKKD